MDQFFEGTFWEVFLTYFSISTVRYFLVAGSAFLIVYVCFEAVLSACKIQRRKVKTSDIQREILFSVITFLCFGITAAVILATPVREYTLVYNQFSDRGWFYTACSFLLLLAYHDAYFYWTHRLLHSTKWMRSVHALHHRSHTPTPWAAFSFHPVESFVQAGVIFTAAFLIPLHPATVFFFLLWMTIYNVYEHLGYEIVPQKYHDHVIGKWFSKALDHDLHHEQGEGNFGLYFTFWDRMMRTKRQNKGSNL